VDVAIIFDCEFLTSDGAPSRFWCGPYDPDPVIAQIGAVKISLDGDCAIRDTFRVYVKPVDRQGNPYALDPLFTKLTGITNEIIATEGQSLMQALAALEAFSEGVRLWSWGKDEFNMIAISCYVANLSPPIPASRFDNACKLLLKAGMPYEDLKKTRSNTLADYYDIDHPPLLSHDARDDALSVAYTLQHLLRNGTLSAADFA